MQHIQYVPTLFIPSLNSEDFITLVNVSKEESVEFLTHFTAMTELKRKVKTNPDAIDDVLDLIEGSNLNLAALVDDESLAELVEKLSKSEIPGARGRRAVFVDVANDIIGIGTTVIYNRNWAMLGVTDSTVLPTVITAVAEAA